MSNHYYGPALEAELAYRQDALRHDAELHRLARAARGSGRAARWLGVRHRTVEAQPAVPVLIPTAPTAEHRVDRAA